MHQLKVEFQPGSAVTARHLQVLNELADAKFIGLYELVFVRDVVVITFPFPLGSIPRETLEHADYCIMKFKFKML